MSDRLATVESMFERSIETSGLPVRQRLDELLSAQPGPDVLSALYAIDRSTLTEAEQLAWFSVFERVNAWMFAQRLTVMAEIAGPEPHSSAVPDGHGPEEVDWIREELAALLRLSPSTTARWMELARNAAGWLRPARDALGSARIGIAHFYALATTCEDLPEHTARVVQRDLLAMADVLSLPAFKRRLKKAVIAADPRDADERHEDAVAQRKLSIYADGEGTAAVLAEHLPAHQAEMIFNVIDARIRRISIHDPRTVDQQRADELIAVFGLASADPGLPSEHRRRPDVQLIIDLPTVLGLADNPGELVDYGPIPPRLARQIAYDGKWRRLITDPTSGALLDYGRTTYSHRRISKTS